MNELKTLIENSGGLNSLDQLLKTIADALNVSVGQLQSNLPDYLEQIGRYGLIDNIMNGLWFSLFIGVLTSVMVIVILFGLIFVENLFKFKIKYFLTAGIIPFATLFIFNVIQQVMLYWASPQIYAIKYLKDMLGM